ncbi:MAG: DDE transposase family protein [Fischerella sp. CENA71]|nr:DDE transposase family protein [Fischerella sp. CENA71]
MELTSQKLYIVKRPAGNCEIIPNDEVAEDDNPEIIEKWGPFESQGEAIARRVGLIRAGKCQPV